MNERVIRNEHVDSYASLDTKIDQGMTCLSECTFVRTLGVLELSSGAVKLLIYRVPANYELSPFDFSRFRRYSSKTSTSECIDSEGRMKMHFFSRRVLPEIWEMVNKAKSLGVDMLFTVATAAYRKAINRDEIAECIRRDCGISLSILSGTDEALAVQAAVTGSLPHTFGKRICIIDQGRASTEISFVNDNGTDIYGIESGTSDFISKMSETLRGDVLPGCRLGDVLKGISQDVKDICNENFVSETSYDGEVVGLGSAITLVMEKGRSCDIHGACLTYERIKKVCDHATEELTRGSSIIGDPSELCLKAFGLRRYLALMKELKVDRITVSGAGLWYGVMFRVCDMLFHSKIR